MAFQMIVDIAGKVLLAATAISAIIFGTCHVDKYDPMGPLIHVPLIGYQVNVPGIKLYPPPLPPPALPQHPTAALVFSTSTSELPKPSASTKFQIHCADVHSSDLFNTTHTTPSEIHCYWKAAGTDFKASEYTLAIESLRESFLVRKFRFVLFWWYDTLSDLLNRPEPMSRALLIAGGTISSILLVQQIVGHFGQDNQGYLTQIQDLENRNEILKHEKATAVKAKAEHIEKIKDLEQKHAAQAEVLQAMEVAIPTGAKGYMFQIQRLSAKVTRLEQECATEIGTVDDQEHRRQVKELQAENASLKQKVRRADDEAESLVKEYISRRKAQKEAHNEHKAQQEMFQGELEKLQSFVDSLNDQIRELKNSKSSEPSKEGVQELEDSKHTEAREGQVQRLEDTKSTEPSEGPTTQQSQESQFSKAESESILASDIEEAMRRSEKDQ